MRNILFIQDKIFHTIQTRKHRRRFTGGVFVNSELLAAIVAELLVFV
jgi:hypothetical protein